MVNSAKASDLSLIEPVLKKYKNTAGSLITVLQEIQDIYGYLPCCNRARHRSGNGFRRGDILCAVSL